MLQATTTSTMNQRSAGQDPHENRDPDKNRNPYEELPPSAYWKLAVTGKRPPEIEHVWTPKFELLAEQKYVTFGSCFAQHIGRHLARRGFGWLNTEPAPAPLGGEVSERFNYGIFSSRTGNIYTTSLLEQWTRWALTHAPIPEEVWHRDGRFYDPFRPRIEPNGFESEQEVRQSRGATLSAFRKAIVGADVFVFTLGLTESWWNTSAGYEYPMCPGTVAGDYDAAHHHFNNQRFSDILSKLEAAIALMRSANPKLSFLLTVSPVPLVATCSGRHVLVATTASKSILRAVAGQLAEDLPYIDYFPSYELITGFPFRKQLFEENQRTVAARGVDFVMNTFFKSLNPTAVKNPTAVRGGSKTARPRSPLQTTASSDVVCEEALLDAFGPQPDSGPKDGSTKEP